MARLPTVGGDKETWGTVLNEYLRVGHKTDGTHGITSDLVTDVVNSQSDAGAAYTIPATTVAGINDLTLTQNCALTFPTPVAGQSFLLILRQGGSGSYTVTYPNIVYWAGGTAPTLTTTIGAIDILVFFSSDGSHWFGVISGQNMKAS